MSNQTPEWLQPIWNGSDIGISTEQPLLKVFHSPQAWRRFIGPRWLNAEKVVKPDAIDWAQWALLLMLAEPSSDPEKGLVLRNAALAGDKVVIELDIEPDPNARQDLDVEAQRSMIAKGSRKVFRPGVSVEFKIAGRKGIVTQD